jgi:hypothetical protein
MLTQAAIPFAAFAGNEGHATVRMQLSGTDIILTAFARGMQ